MFICFEILKMKIFFSNFFIALVFCLTAVNRTKSIASSGNVLSSLISEVLGLASSYRTVGNVLRINEGCEHALIKPRIPRLMDFDLRKPGECFKQRTNYGTIALQPDHGKRVEKVIRDHGYHMLTYNNVTSIDGYIQTIFRITGSPKSPPRKGKQAVLIIHGAMSSVDTFFLLGKRSLPFKLADEGYDVWLPANRGTDYSQGHLKYNADNDLEYWNFSFHEIAVYDLPMYLKLVLSETGEKKVFYIGYSLGAFVFPALLAERPEFNEKIHASFLFGAGVYSNHATSASRIAIVLLDMPYRLQELLNRALHGNAAGRVAHLLSHFGSIICSASPVHCSLCGTLATVAGLDTFQLNYVSIYDNNFASSFIVFPARMVKKSKCGKSEFDKQSFKYDYGPEKNTEYYGQSTAPTYNLLNVRAPIYIYYGSSDDMVVPQDLKRFGDALPPGTIKGYRVSPWVASEHLSFISSNNAPEVFYDRILNDMKEYL